MKKHIILGATLAASLMTLGTAAHAQHYNGPHRDLDRDGIANRYDRDRDGDGVRNRYDRDRDGDGIANRYDRHPNRHDGMRMSRFGPRGDLDRDGIQNRHDRDRDGDGIRNARDRYPDDRRYS
jgi:hypothetical protein